MFSNVCCLFSSVIFVGKTFILTFKCMSGAVGVRPGFRIWSILLNLVGNLALACLQPGNGSYSNRLLVGRAERENLLFNTVFVSFVS